jgi:hypothetical protein
MKKKIAIIVLIALVICLIPIHKLTSDLPYETYNAILYKYIKYNNESLYDFEYKDQVVIFPLNFRKTTKQYNNQVQQVYICNKGHTCVETILGNYEWNKKNNDEIFPIARNYKEVLSVHNNETLYFDKSYNVYIDSTIIYDVNTTNTLKDKIDVSSPSTINIHDLENGEYIISIKTIAKENKDNKVEYSFKINIED